jgi:hypothetical protein
LLLRFRTRTKSPRNGQVGQHAVEGPGIAIGADLAAGIASDAAAATRGA